MAKDKVKDCKSHMCGLAKSGKLKKIQKLASNPSYICMKCGRVADDQCNVCKPKAFDE